MSGRQDAENQRIPHGLRVLVVLLSLAVAAGFAIGQWALMVTAEGPLFHANIEPSEFTRPAVTIALAVLGAVVVLRGDARRYGWLILGLGVSSGIIDYAGLHALHTFDAGRVAPLSVWVQDLWMVNWALSLLLLPALFPDGSAASARWRIAVRFTGLLWILLIVAMALADRPATNVFLVVDSPPDNPLGILDIPMMVINITWVVASLASVSIGIGSLVTRWRVADTRVRRQYKWVIFGFVVLLGGVAVDVVLQVVQETLATDLEVGRVMRLVSSIAALGFVIAFGLAVLRLRLYDVDLVISRTVVYGVLTIVILSGYVAVVAGLGSFLPVEESLLALLATGMTAVAFAPLREWLQTRVNRLLFGQRGDPYGVLSEMGRLMTDTGSPEEMLQTLTETIARSLKLPAVAIEIEQDGDWAVRASFGGDVDHGGVIVPLRHQGELVGRLVVLPRSPRDPLDIRDLDLLRDIAHPAGAIARSVRLTTALQMSRERLVVAREDERRRIRRDLHDGLGPSLASHTFQLDEVLELLDADPERAAEITRRLKQQTRDLVADIRRLVYELRPPALDELGVAAALTAHVAKFNNAGPISIEVRTIPDPLPALSAAIEVATYRIVREAITNSVQHAGASRCVVSLEANEESLTITVRDDGSGIGDFRSGVGLLSMRERSEELGGTFEIVSPNGHGTEVRAVLPLKAVSLQEHVEEART